MNELIRVALVLLACALVLGVGGGVLLASESVASTGSQINALPAQLPTHYGATASFCDPVSDPSCWPPRH